MFLIALVPVELLRISPPGGSYHLPAEGPVDAVCLVGGIGITPMMAMVRQLQAEGLRPFKLYYFTRDPEGTAFLDDLRAPELAGQVIIHHDHGDPARSFDLWKIFEKVATGTHVYCCGPKGLMDTVKNQSQWKTRRPAKYCGKSLTPTPRMA